MRSYRPSSAISPALFCAGLVIGLWCSHSDRVFGAGAGVAAAEVSLAPGWNFRRFALAIGGSQFGAFASAGVHVWTTNTWAHSAGNQAWTRQRREDGFIEAQQPMWLWAPNPVVVSLDAGTLEDEPPRVSWASEPFEPKRALVSSMVKDNYERALLAKAQLFSFETQDSGEERGYQIEYEKALDGGGDHHNGGGLAVSRGGPEIYTDSKHLAGFERVWVYTQGIALAQFSRGQTQQDRRSAQALARYLCRKRAFAPGSGTPQGWPFSWNTDGDDWKDVRLVTGANAWAVHGLGRFITSPAYDALPSDKDKGALLSCYRDTLTGLIPHQRSFLLDDGRKALLMTAGWTTQGLVHAAEPFKLRTESGEPVTVDPKERFAYYSILDAIGYDTYGTPPTIQVCRQQQGIDCYAQPFSGAAWQEKEISESVWRALRKRVKAENVVTEHNLDVLAVLNHAIEHQEVLGLSEGLELETWRDRLRDGIFYGLWDADGWKAEFRDELRRLAPKAKAEQVSFSRYQVARERMREQGMLEALRDEDFGRIVTGGAFRKDASGALHFDQSTHSAIDNCSWLSLSVDYQSLSGHEEADSLDSSYVPRLAQCLKYTVLRYVRHLGFDDVDCDTSLSSCPFKSKYLGAHYFQNAFEDPYIAPSELQESSYHLEATMGLIMGLQAFAEAYPAHPESAAFEEEASNLWAEAQHFVQDHGFPYSSQRIQNLSTLLPSSTAMIWFVDAHDALRTADPGLGLLDEARTMRLQTLGFSPGLSLEDLKVPFTDEVNGAPSCSAGEVLDASPSDVGTQTVAGWTVENRGSCGDGFVLMPPSDKPSVLTRLGYAASARMALAGQVLSQTTRTLMPQGAGGGTAGGVGLASVVGILWEAMEQGDLEPVYAVMGDRRMNTMRMLLETPPEHSTVWSKQGYLRMRDVFWQTEPDIRLHEIVDAQGKSVSTFRKGVMYGLVQPHQGMPVPYPDLPIFLGLTPDDLVAVYRYERAIKVSAEDYRGAKWAAPAGTPLPEGVPLDPLADEKLREAMRSWFANVYLPSLDSSSSRLALWTLRRYRMYFRYWRLFMLNKETLVSLFNDFVLLNDTAAELYGESKNQRGFETRDLDESALAGLALVEVERQISRVEEALRAYPQGGEVDVPKHLEAPLQAFYRVSEKLNAHASAMDPWFDFRAESLYPDQSVSDAMIRASLVRLEQDPRSMPAHRLTVNRELVEFYVRKFLNGVQWRNGFWTDTGIQEGSVGRSSVMEAQHRMIANDIARHLDPTIAFMVDEDHGSRVPEIGQPKSNDKADPSWLTVKIDHLPKAAYLLLLRNNMYNYEVYNPGGEVLGAPKDTIQTIVDEILRASIRKDSEEHEGNKVQLDGLMAYLVSLLESVRADGPVVYYAPQRVIDLIEDAFGPSAIRFHLHPDPAAKNDSGVGSISIRPIRVEDLFNGYLLTLDSLSSASGMTEEKAIEVFERIQSDPNHVILVVVQDDKVIGATTLLMEPKLALEGGTVCHIEDVAIHEDHQSKKIGSKLMRASMSYAQDAKCSKTVLNCEEKLLGFYGHLGFGCTGVGLRFDHPKDSWKLKQRDLPVGLIIRRLEERDLDNGYLRVLDSLGLTSTLTLEAALRVFERIRKNPNHVILVAVRGEQVIGAVTLLIEPKFIHNGRNVCHIEDLVVHNNHRGQNIGYELTAAALRHAENSDCYKSIADCSIKDVNVHEEFGIWDCHSEAMAVDHPPAQSINPGEGGVSHCIAPNNVSWEESNAGDTLIVTAGAEMFALGIKHPGLAGYEYLAHDARWDGWDPVPECLDGLSVTQYSRQPIPLSVLQSLAHHEVAVFKTSGNDRCEEQGYLLVTSGEWDGVSFGGFEELLDAKREPHAELLGHMHVDRRASPLPSPGDYAFLLGRHQFFVDHGHEGGHRTSLIYPKTGNYAYEFGVPGSGADSPATAGRSWALACPDWRSEEFEAP